ncbi:MAG: TonB-dependent receptor, partial [Spirochaetota bacterium]|nr:TonB-dependent receptor [Spirochaetota bacterium]
FYREMRDFEGKVNTNLKAQQSIHYVLSGDLNYKMWGRPFKFITAAYYKQLNDLVPYEIDNVRIRYYATNNSKGFATGVDFRLNGQFVKGIDSWVNMSVMTIQENIKNDYYYSYRDSTGAAWHKGYSNLPVHDSTLHHPGYIPRPTDQRVTFNLFFQDYLPKIPSCKMHLNLIYGTGLPFGPPSHDKYKDTLRMPSYRRVDIGFSYQLLKEDRKKKEKGFGRYIKSAWTSLEVLNLLAVNNTVSYTWVKDVTNRLYAIPNYLTNRQLNIKLQLRF